MIPQNATKIEVENATLPFYEFTLENGKFYGFDSSNTVPPEPMVNAMVGLELLKNEEKLMMINHKSPGGLFPKIEGEFDYEESILDDGKACIIFSKTSTIENTTDFTQNSCDGGKCSH